MDTTDLTRTTLSILQANDVLEALTQLCVRETRRALAPYVDRPLADLRVLMRAYAEASKTPTPGALSAKTWNGSPEALAILRVLEERADETELATPELVGRVAAGLVAVAVDADTLLRRPWASEYVPPAAPSRARPTCGITCGCSACVAKWAGVPPLERQHDAIMSRGK